MKNSSVGFEQFAITDQRHNILRIDLYLLSAFAVFLLGVLAHGTLFSKVPGPALDRDLDASLERAAIDALAQYPGQEGTVIIVDPQTGRIRALVNPQVAFGRTFAPGSTIKPFITLAAMRSKLIGGRSRLLCREKYSHKDFETTCSHPRNLPALNASEAIAYSCNSFFGTVGEQLSASALDEILVEFGFGEPTGADESESPGAVLRNQWQVKSALGEGDHVLVTPVQLLMAYSALANGGNLLKSHQEPPDSFLPETRRQISLTANERSTIMQGLRGSVVYGTAQSSHLDSLPFFTFGKTGTATQINGFRTDGWFVGFASPPAKEESPTLGVVVLLRKAHGADAARLAKPIFEAFAENLRPTETTQRPDFTLAVPPPTVSETNSVKVHLVSENVTRSISLEDYVTGVVATEGSMDQETEALKALAVASRTFAVKNINRHEADGYNFCSTTHCQRYRFDPLVARLIRQAVADTAGEVLLETDGHVAESYFGASCGGATANLQTLWGPEAPVYLRGVRDDFCISMPHANWTDEITTERLLMALHTDSRTNVGNRLDKLFVSRRDTTGRAQSIVIEGEQRRVVSGWDFKIIIGRALGWNLIKSSRFEISRGRSGFIFRGSGFGHGLGLCQEGSHVMARRGADYRQILAKYFPGISIGRPGTFADLFWSAAAEKPHRRAAETRRMRRVSSEHFRLSYPIAITESEAEELLGILEGGWNPLVRRVAAAGFVIQLKPIDVYLNSSTGDFVSRTGQPSWAAGASLNGKIELQPFPLLKRRGILETTVRHELVHVVVRSLRRRESPRWLEEGFAIYLAGEGPLVLKYSKPGIESSPNIEKMLQTAGTHDEMRTAYAAAYSQVTRMISKHGEARVWRLVAGTN